MPYATRRWAARARCRSLARASTRRGPAGPRRSAPAAREKQDRAVSAAQPARRSRAGSLRGAAARSGCALRSSCANAPREQLRECTAKPRRACVDGQLARRSRERVGWTGIRGEEGAWDVLSCAPHLSASVPAACILGRDVRLTTALTRSFVHRAHAGDIDFGRRPGMSVPLAPVDVFCCPVCRTPLRGLTRDYYPMCIGWGAADRMNREMGNAYGGPIPPFMDYSHAVWYPEVMAVVQLWCLQNGPHACVRKGYGNGDICHNSMNLSGCTCDRRWV